MTRKLAYTLGSTLLTASVLPPASPSACATTRMLKEIVVAAQRRAESEQEVPLPVGAITSQTTVTPSLGASPHLPPRCPACSSRRPIGEAAMRISTSVALTKMNSFREMPQRSACTTMGVQCLDGGWPSGPRRRETH
jgi:hypothetical protein